MALKAAIFDLDGLLIDSEKVAYACYCDLLAGYGRKFALDEYAAHYSGGTEDTNMSRMIADYELPISVDEGTSFMHAREAERTADGVPLMLGVRQMLEHLQSHGVTIALATSSTPKRAEDLLENNEVLHYFAVRAFGPEVARSKPAPDIFELAARRCGEAPHNCLVFEDSEAGVMAAHAAGIPVICVPSIRKPKSQVAKLALAVVDDLSQAIPVVDGLLDVKRGLAPFDTKYTV